MDISKLSIFIPSNLKRFKLDLFERIGRTIKGGGGSVIRGNVQDLASLPNEMIPIVGCMPELTDLISHWKATKRRRIQWDRGYL